MAIFEHSHILTEDELLRQLGEKLKTSSDFSGRVAGLLESQGENKDQGKVEPEFTTKLDYTQLAFDFQKEKPQGKTAILWMAQKGITPEWTEGNFKGARQALPALTNKSRAQFAEFYQATFHTSMSRANNNSIYYSECFLMDADVAYNLLGKDHFKDTIQPKLVNICAQYQVANDAKRQEIIQQEFGIIVNFAWVNLPGIGFSDGSAGESNSVLAIGEHFLIDGNVSRSSSRSIMLSERSGFICAHNVFYSRLCLLA